MSVKLKVEIDQNKPSLISSKVCYEVISDGLTFNVRHLNQIGIYPECVQGYTARFEPTGLTINPFIERGEDDKLEQFTNRVNKFINDANMTKFSEVLRIDRINAIQIIKINKI